MNSAIQIADPPSDPPRKRGRPAGLPKTGGRQKGIKTWTSDEIRNALLDRSDAVETLADICAGRELRVAGPTGKEIWRRPTMAERLRALDLVMRKTLPDLQATELTGRDGSDLFSKSVGPEHDLRDLSRVIMEVLEEAAALEGAEDTAGKR